MKRTSLESIELRKMGFSYDGLENVFKNFNFHFNAGEVLYLQGHRGSGKNTLIKLLLGLLSPSEGEYLINGTCVNNFSYSEFDGFRLNMGHSFDVGGLINNHTLYENFRLFLDYHDFLGADARFDYIVKMFERFNLENQKHLRPAFVSGSASKAASVLRAFAMQPEMVLLDNPTQGLSKEHIPALVELIKEHQEKHNLKHVILSSDDLTLINQLPGRIMKVMPSGFLEEIPLRRAV